MIKIEPLWPTTGPRSHPAIQALHTLLSTSTKLYAELGMQPWTPDDADALVALGLMRSGKTYLDMFFAALDALYVHRRIEWAVIEKEFAAHRSNGRFHGGTVLGNNIAFDISDGTGTADAFEKMNAHALAYEPENDDERQLQSVIRRYLAQVATPAVLDAFRAPESANLEVAMSSAFAQMFPSPLPPFLGEKSGETPEPSVTGWKEVLEHIERKTGKRMSERQAKRLLPGFRSGRGLRVQIPLRSLDELCRSIGKGTAKNGKNGK